MTGVAVALAGEVAIQHGGLRADEAQLGVGQVQLVFALLVRERRRAVPRHELADALWPDDLPSTWGSALRSLVSKVRSFLTAVDLPADALVSVGGSYQLRIDDMVVDLEEAARQVSEATDALADGRARDAAAEASAAVITLSRPLLASLDAPWLDRWRAELDDLAVQAGELAAAALVDIGDGADAVRVATATITRAPYRESAHRLLMRAHEAAGNRAEALKAYERCRKQLADEMGVNPDPETEALYVHLLGTEPSSPPARPTRAEAAPTATATFLFTDIEGSTSMWERSPDDMSASLAMHDDVLRNAVESHGGRVFKHTGDGMCAAFGVAKGAIAAAVDAQRDLASDSNLRVRIGVHTGEVQVRADDYAGIALSRVDRLCSLASGGQILVSSASRVAVDDDDIAPAELRPIGDVQLRGFASPETVYQLVHPELQADFAPLPDGAARRPVPVPEDGDLLGRDEELAAALTALSDVRLLTITGPGGVGKTRLAISAANRVDSVDVARVWWVELASVDATEVADATANVVGGAGAGADVIDAVVAAVAVAPAVVVFDNAEHIRDAVAALVQTLLNRVATVRVVVTSRIPLGLSSEHVLSLAPLECPDDDADLDTVLGCASVRLFSERAHAASPRFELSAANGFDVAEICRRLDGLPLALELAAARVHSIPPAEIVRFLDERLRLLRRTTRDRSGRHRSLEETVRWSYELLDADEQRAFNRLSVFAGSFTPAAAAAVIGMDDPLDVLDLLDSLAERSMIVAAATATEARYRVLETLAEFGRRRLDEEGATVDALDARRDYYLGLVDEAAVAIQGPHEARWVETIHGDFADIRSVVTRAVEELDTDTAVRIVVALFDYAFFRMRREVGPWAEAAIALPGAADHELYAPTAAVAGYLAWVRGDVATAERLTDLSLAARPTWVGWDSRAAIKLFAGDVDASVAAFETAADMARAAGNKFLEAIALSQVAFAMVFAGRDDAYDVATSGEAVARATGNPTARIEIEWAIGIALYARAPRRALELLEEVMALSLSVDNRLAYGSAATPAEELRTKLGTRTVSSDLDAALEQVDYWMSIGGEPNVWLTVRRIARDFAGLGDYEAAALAFGAEASATSKLPMRGRESDRHEAAVTRAAQALGAAEYERLTARGASLSAEGLLAELRRHAALVTAG